MSFLIAGKRRHGIPFSQYMSILIAGKRNHGILFSQHMSILSIFYSFMAGEIGRIESSEAWLPYQSWQEESCVCLLH